MYCVDIEIVSQVVVVDFAAKFPTNYLLKSTNLLKNLNSSMLLDLSWPVDAWLCGLECPDWPVQLIGLIWICARMNVTELLCLISNTYSTSSGPDWPRAVRADPDGHQRHPHPPHPAPLLDSLRQGRWKWTQWGNGNGTEKDYLKLWLSHSAEWRI